MNFKKPVVKRIFEKIESVEVGKNSIFKADHGKMQLMQKNHMKQGKFTLIKIIRVYYLRDQKLKSDWY